MDHEREFRDELAFTNLGRAWVACRFLVVTMPILMIAIDVQNVLRLEGPVRRVILAVHVAVLAINGALLLVATRRRPADPSGITRGHHVLGRTMCLSILLSVDALWVMAFHLRHNTAVYVMAVFIYAVVFSYPGFVDALVYAFQLAFFLVVIASRGGAVSADADVYITGTVATVSALYLSRKILEDRRTDFDHRKTIEEQSAALQARNVELARLNAEKNEFLGIAAHDLKNPLNTILGYTELLLDEKDLPRDEAEDLLGRIRGASRRMFELVKNLLDVNAIERGEIKATLGEVDLAALARSVADPYRAAARAKSQTLEVDVAPGLPLAFGDRDLLHQVLDNLISNAVKYSPLGKRVVVRLRSAEGGVRCEVVDEGPGLSAADRDKLFGKFVKLSARPTGGEHSTGLGLSIVKRLVESMKGRVWCESEPGKGATFIVEVPQRD